MPITVSGTSITFNDSTTQTTAFTGSGGVTSLNGQTGAITNTGLDNIGSYAWVAYTGSVGLVSGQTVAGSSLYYPNTIVGYTYGQYALVSNGDTNRNTPFTEWGFNYYTNTIRNTSGNTGFQVPAGASALSGTWRAMAWVYRRYSEYNPCNNSTNSFSPFCLFVRIS